jgi:hypothetical protein
MKATDDLKAFTIELIAEGEALEKTSFASSQQRWVSPENFSKFASGGRLLLKKLGPFGSVWESAFDSELKHFLVVSSKMLGALRSILEAIENGRLISIEERVEVEVLGDLMEHAEILLKDKHYLACCVVQRAVLEERLRNLCQKWQCAPTKAKPGIDDYNQALYAKGKSDPTTDFHKATMQWVTAMAAIGNDAAHIVREITRDDAERMRRELTSFLAKFAP